MSDELTQFGPHSDDNKPSRSFFSRLFRSVPNDVTVAAETTPSASADSLPRENATSIADENLVDEREEISLASESYKPHQRNLTSVLSRLNTMFDRKSSIPQAYKDSDYKQHWMPDNNCHQCYECGDKFNTFRRRHHCRICGQIFCSRCCNQEVPGKIMGYTGSLRVCTYCGRITLQYAQCAVGSSDITQLSHDLEALVAESNPDSPRSCLSSSFNYGSLSRKGSLPQATSPFEIERPLSGNSEDSNLRKDDMPLPVTNRVMESTELQRVLLLLCHSCLGLSPRTRRHQNIIYEKCLVGSDIVDWMIEKKIASNRQEAILVGKALVEAEILLSITNADRNFVDDASLYKIPAASLFKDVSCEDESEPLWFRQIKSSEGVTVESSSTPDVPSLEKSTSRIQEDENYANKNDFSLCGVADTLYPGAVSSTAAAFQDGLDEEKPESHGKSNASSARHEISCFHWGHLRQLTCQMLVKQKLSNRWADVILNIAHRVSQTVQLKIRSNDDQMDIREYIKVKKMSGGKPSDSSIVHGEVCSKNVVHRDMKNEISNARVLLACMPIEYQRVENKYSELEPQYLQEHEYLKKYIGRISTLKPDILLVEKGVSRVAQEFLLDGDITLVSNVKRSVLERLSRFMMTGLVLSIDGLSSRPTLGLCRLFRTKVFQQLDGSSKTLMFFEGCDPQLGCTIILKGAQCSELVRVKKILLFMIYAAYHSRLEISFLMDEVAALPLHLQQEKENLAPEVPVSASTAQTDLRRSSRNTAHKDSVPKRTRSLSNNRQANRVSEIMRRDFSHDGVCEVHCLKSKQELGAEQQHQRSYEVLDKSDPLQSYQDSHDDTIFDCKCDLKVQSLKAHEVKCMLEENLLSISPLIHIDVPYLLSEQGRKSPLRAFFMEEEIWSDSSLKHNATPGSGDEAPILPRKHMKLGSHAFLSSKVDCNTTKHETQLLICDYRACGSRIPLPENPGSFQLEKTRKLACERGTAAEGSDGLKSHGKSCFKDDCLNLFSHQHISVLFCSFSSLSPNFPNACVDPWVVHMDFYGCNDLPLGMFLERYCFRDQYRCPSDSCTTSIFDHTRRFVHGSTCMQIVLKKMDSCIPGHKNNILMWSRCCICKQVTTVIPMSLDTWSMSFAKYLELRFYAASYCFRDESGLSCSHSLHRDHLQYFACKQFVASFKCCPIELKEISLPVMLIAHHPMEVSLTSVQEELNILFFKGTSVLSEILEMLHQFPDVDDICLTEQLQSEKSLFKEKSEDLQGKVQLAEQAGNALVGDMLWELQDLLVLLKQFIARLVLSWNKRFMEIEQFPRKEKSRSSHRELPRDQDFSQTINSVAEGAAPVASAASVESAASTASAATVEGPPRSSSADLLDSTEAIEAQLPVEVVDDRGHHRSKSLGDSRRSNKLQAAVSAAADDVADRKSSVKFLANFLSAAEVKVKSPFDPGEHLLLPSSSRVPLSVFEQEPSSLIAFTLSSSDYCKQLQELRNKQKELSRRSKRGSDLAESSESEAARKSGVLSFLRGRDSNFGAEGIHFEKLLPEVDDERAEEVNSVEVQFADSEGTSRFLCRAYFAEQFVQLRQLIYPAGEDSFIRSLARCMSWHAEGGKSGSSFCKTKDDRFILKQMSRFEIESFQQLAGDYFCYVGNCQRTRKATALAKILGVYRVGMKSSNGFTLKQDLLVIENLFYRRNIVQKFDLKGSRRNRFVNTSGKLMQDTVLFDENLLKLRVDSALYIRMHSKSILRSAISSDTEFLAAHTVMDYSLLVGVDADNGQLVLGIIDYIRTFTWDKRLEMVVKKASSHLGGQGRMPTVISPDLYRSRFLDAMDKYFLMVPDRWTSQQSNNLQI